MMKHASTEKKRTNYNTIQPVLKYNSTNHHRCLKPPHLHFYIFLASTYSWAHWWIATGLVEKGREGRLQMLEREKKRYLRAGHEWAFEMSPSPRFLSSFLFIGL